MEGRRQFIKLAPAVAALGIAVPALSYSQEEAEQKRTSILGAWRNIHTLPFPPGSFREFLSFAEGGVMHETNSFLHTSSNLDFSMFGLPSVVNGSDGIGNWWRSRAGVVKVRFRKLLFDGGNVNFGDLHVTGVLTVNEGKLAADWHIEAVDANSGTVLTDFGAATSEGIRLS